ncbi:hypothetical protein REJC140_03861 [Pseudorhizobium endolithicum]|uniref:Uncharacterized protein n=1 Tax=Pseudorhizobium endolithicum TaxID=1191678 RepID=A0ABN7JRR6_9HYPH|nr:hypothetical protein [Pseudorhizobium endolithicum]CAD7044741.1 hypothetical protein REJC140_03861 [Pseudorhizobium endolithicum]
MTDNRAVTIAALWLSSQTEPPSDVIQVLRSEFKLTAMQACEACKMAQDLRRLGGSRHGA